MFGKHAAGEIGDQLARMGDALGSLTGVSSVVGGMAGIVGSALPSGADFREMRNGREAARALRARLGQPAMGCAIRCMWPPLPPHPPERISGSKPAAGAERAMVFGGAAGSGCASQSGGDARSLWRDSAAGLSDLFLRASALRWCLTVFHNDGQSVEMVLEAMAWTYLTPQYSAIL